MTRGVYLIGSNNPRSRRANPLRNPSAWQSQQVPQHRNIHPRSAAPLLPKSQHNEALGNTVGKRSLEGSFPVSSNITELHTQKASSGYRFAKALNDPNLTATVLFCLIGLVITAVVMLRFPDLGAIIAQYNQF